MIPDSPMLRSIASNARLLQPSRAWRRTASVRTDLSHAAKSARSEVATARCAGGNPESIDKGVTVYFRTSDVFVQAAPGDNILEVANRCSVDIPTGCLSGSCGSCEVEVTKYETKEGVSEPSTSVVRACIAGIPRGYNLIEIDDVEDHIWGVDGMDL